MIWGSLSAILVIGALASSTAGQQQYAEGIGYVGPSCAVVVSHCKHKTTTQNAL